MTRGVLFGVMSAQQPDSTVSQLVDALGGRPVVVHHDFTKRREFRLPQPNVDFVPQPRVTGWGTWGFVEGIVLLIEHALRHHDFDYFQLLSPTCLPIRTVEEFEAFVSSATAEVHADLIPLCEDPDALMHFGYRVFTANDTLRFKAARRISSWYFDDTAALEQTRSLSMRRRAAGPIDVPARAALWLTRLAAATAVSRSPFDAGFLPTVGSTWFGARRAVCEYLVARIRAPEISRYFRRLHLCDEIVLGSVIANSGFRLGPSNHTVSPFDPRGHPVWITEDELRRKFDTGRFFARKFPEEAGSEVRRLALERAGATAVKE
jgi:hypothetical protein